MRVQLLSDLHLEMYRDDGEAFLKRLDPSGVDLIVLAGDICSMDMGDRMFSIMDFFCKNYPRVLFVAGNHEYYLCSVTEANKDIDDLEKTFSNLTVLRSGKIVEYMGKRFVGDTMWFRDEPNNVIYKRYLNDFRLIRGLEPWCYEQNTALRKFLEAELRKGDVVITHHLPSSMSVGSQYKTSELNRFFVSHEERLILEKKPAYWFHGHGHQSKDYFLGETRIICNPAGYPSEGNTGFDPKLVIELD